MKAAREKKGEGCQPSPAMSSRFNQAGIVNKAELEMESCSKLNLTGSQSGCVIDRRRRAEALIIGQDAGREVDIRDIRSIHTGHIRTVKDVESFGE